MKKVNILIAVVLFLLCINIVLSGILLRAEKIPSRPLGPRNEIIKKLHFDKVQEKNYDLLISKHRAEIEKAQDSIKILKNTLYSQLKSQSESLISDSIVMEICKIQGHIEYIHLNHFKDIQGLCSKEQQKYFDQLTEEIAFLFSPNPHPRRK